MQNIIPNCFFFSDRRFVMIAEAAFGEGSEEVAFVKKVLGRDVIFSVSLLLALITSFISVPSLFLRLLVCSFLFSSSHYICFEGDNIFPDELYHDIDH